MADHFRTALDWENVRFFVALARHGSLSAAARALTVNHATVARRVARLEATLGTSLIERRPDGYMLTAAGRDALAAADAMDTAAQSLIRSGTAAAVSGLVRINAPPSLVSGFLVSQLASLSVQQPGLDVELVADTRLASLARREADLALRFGRPSDGDLIARRLVAIGFGFYASIEWKERLAQGIPPVFVSFDESNAHVPEAVWLSRHYASHRMAFRANSHATQGAAARSGWGVVLLPHFLGRTDASLVPVVLAEQPLSRELWLLTRREGAKDMRVRTTRDFLTELFRGQRARFE